MSQRVKDLLDSLQILHESDSHKLGCLISCSDVRVVHALSLVGQSDSDEEEVENFNLVCQAPFSPGVWGRLKFGVRDTPGGVSWLVVVFLLLVITR